MIRVTLILLLSFSAKAETISESLGLDSMPIPATLRSRAAEYLEMVGVNSESVGSIGGGNLGVERYFMNLTNANPCFSQLADQFDRSLRSRPRVELTLNSSTDDSTHGWLWDQALKSSNGNSNLAMLLVGRCGHDNWTCNLEFILNARHQQGSLGESTILPEDLRNQIARGCCQFV